MTQFKKVDNIESTLFDYYQNRLREAERIAVERWIAEDEKHATLARQVDELVVCDRLLANLDRTDTVQAYSAVEKELSRRRFRPTLQRATRIAAVLMLPLITWVLTIRFEQSRLADSMVEVTMARGMIGSVILPDSSEVWLNSGSTLRYPSRFTDDNRCVVLSGEAYFKVRKDNGRKFSVLLPEKNDFTVEVLGTEFNVDAYPNVDFVTTTLVSGKVRVAYCDAERQTGSLIMSPNERLTYDVNSHAVGKQKLSKVLDAEWHNNRIVLDNTPIRDLLHTLGKRYNVEFVLSNPKLEVSNFTGTFENLSLDRILEYMTLSSGLHYERHYAIDGENGGKERVIIHD